MLVFPLCERARLELIDEEFVVDVLGVFGFPDLGDGADFVPDRDERTDLERVVARYNTGGFPRGNEPVDRTGLFVVLEEPVYWTGKFARVFEEHAVALWLRGPIQESERHRPYRGVYREHVFRVGGFVLWKHRVDLRVSEGFGLGGGPRGRSVPER